jgi:hypothetical protein
MGRPVEFNTVLALREYNSSDEYSENQCVPHDNVLTVQSLYEFHKTGYRVLEVGKAIPLVVTEGNQKFIRVVGLVVVSSLSVEINPNGGVDTTGIYKIVRLFSGKESKQWLEFLSPQHETAIWF